MEENEIKIVCICIVIMYFCAPMTIASPISLLQSVGGFGVTSAANEHLNVLSDGILYVTQGI